MLRFFFNLITTLLSLSLLNQIYGIRVEPRVINSLNTLANEKVDENQLCVIKTLKQLVSTNGRIPPKITKKKINQAVTCCKEKIATLKHPTIVEETIFMTLGQYGHLSQIDVIKTFNFISEIQKESTSAAGSYTRIYMLTQNNNFCKLYDDFILSAYPNEYYVSFLPEDGERCQELLKRLKQNSFYSYWGQGGVVADQAQPIIDDNVSNDPVKTKDTAINNIFQNPQTQMEEIPNSDNDNNQADPKNQKEDEKQVLTESDIENMELEADESHACCSSSSKKSKKESNPPQRVIDNSMSEEELELMRLEEELDKKKSGCCSSCSSNKGEKNDKKKDQENKRNESLDDIVGDVNNLNDSEMENENKKSCSCSSSNKKNNKKPEDNENNIIDQKMTKNEEFGTIDGTMDNSTTKKEPEHILLKNEFKKEVSTCCSCSSSSKKEKDEKKKKNKHMEEFDFEEEFVEQELVNDKKSKSKDKKKSDETHSENSAPNYSISDDLESDSKSGCCSSSSCKSKSSKNEVNELDELERELEEEEQKLRERMS